MYGFRLNSRCVFVSIEKNHKFQFRIFLPRVLEEFPAPKTTGALAPNKLAVIDLGQTKWLMQAEPDRRAIHGTRITTYRA